ncbi:MAG: S8 family serine peptidase [Fibromonadaceae bacterium]|jgi:hypothetical protein|nr:S8 family serine peptidase [Fibromonadaceae bacterium]
MKMSIKTPVFMIFLLCIWQIAYSQFLDTYPSDKKINYLLPYDNNIVVISPEVEKWMKEELAKNYETRTIEMKTDVLGRAKRTGLNTKGSEYRQVVVPRQKRLVTISDMHIRENNMESAHMRYEYNTETKKYDYSFNGKKINEKEYNDIIKKRNETFDLQKKGKRNLLIPNVIFSDDDRHWTALMTAEEISELIRNYKEVAIDDYKEPGAGAGVASILSSVQLSTHAFPNNYTGREIGVYVNEWDCFAPTFGIVNPTKYTMVNPCYPWLVPDIHHNLVVSIVQNASPSAHIFGFNGPLQHPSNPFSYSPPIEIGNHSYFYYATNNLYTNMDMNMDNYIYENRVINFVIAGNYRSPQDPTYYVSPPGKALNAITVGAVEPATMRYAWYSKHINSEIGNNKPELATYTDIDMGIYGFLNGTSAASPLAAGFTASLLDQHPFFKRQPALTKALLITGETIPIQNAHQYPGNVAKAIANYSSVAWWTRSAWWDGDNSAFFDSNNEIKFTENNILANKRYRIAIAWLVPGNYMNNVNINPSKRISQDLDLYVEQNGTVIASSASAQNPFEIVDFVTTSNAPLTITIKRFSNSGHGRVLLGYHMRENL